LSVLPFFCRPCQYSSVTENTILSKFLFKSYWTGTETRSSWTHINLLKITKNNIKSVRNWCNWRKMQIFPYFPTRKIRSTWTLSAFNYKKEHKKRKIIALHHCWKMIWTPQRLTVKASLMVNLDVQDLSKYSKSLPNKTKVKIQVKCKGFLFLFIVYLFIFIQLFILILAFLSLSYSYQRRVG
jgi:hypothetical protein